MMNEETHTSIHSQMNERLQTLRAVMYRNALVARFKNYPGSHMEETHITLFNLAHPSQGKVGVGAGGANVRGKTEDDDDSGGGGGSGAGTEFLKQADLKKAADEASRLASMTEAQLRAERARDAAATVGGQRKFGQITSRGQQLGTAAASPDTKAAYEAATNSAENLQRAQAAVWASQHLEDYHREPNAQEIAKAINSGAAKRAWDDVKEQHRELLKEALRAHIADSQSVKTNIESVWAGHYARDVQLRADRYAAMTPAQRSQQVVTENAIKAQIAPYREANSAARAALTKERTELRALQNGLNFMRRKVAVDDLIAKGLSPENISKSESMGVQGPRGKTGATQESIDAQKLVVAGKQAAFAQTKLALRDAEKVATGKIQGERRSETEQRRQASQAPNIKAYEAQLETPNTTYWRQYIQPLRTSTAKTAESAGLSFLQDHFRNLETGTSGKQTYRNTTQENLDKLWDMVSRDRMARPSMTTEQQGGARQDMIDFIVKTFGASGKKISKYKELSNLQFFYKVLREINAASAILKSYKNRRSVNNIGNVVKQNMARYFRV